MSKVDVFSSLKESINELLPDIDLADINYEESLKDLGANSVDRMDIIIETMEKINVRIPLVEFGNAKCIKNIVDIMCRYSGE